MPALLVPVLCVRVEVLALMTSIVAETHSACFMKWPGWRKLIHVHKIFSLDVLSCDN